jgi:hypothetical protein
MQAMSDCSISNIIAEYSTQLLGLLWLKQRL